MPLISITLPSTFSAVTESARSAPPTPHASAAAVRSRTTELVAIWVSVRIWSGSRGPCNRMLVEVV